MTTLFYYDWFFCWHFEIQVAHELPAPDCEAFIQLGSQAICDVAEAVAAIKKAENV